MQPRAKLVLVQVDSSPFKHISIEQKSYESPQQGVVLMKGAEVGEDIVVGKRVRYKAYKDQDASFQDEVNGKEQRLAYIADEDIVAVEE